jgi:predicted nuclease of predicted toxin-antitoxin system
VKILAQAGFEAAHWSSLGAANASDTAILAFARANGYVVLTHDLDFSAILAASHGRKPSVVQIRSENVSAEAIGAAVIAALQQTALQLDEGALLSVDPARARLRLPPLPQR